MHSIPLPFSAEVKWIEAMLRKLPIWFLRFLNDSPLSIANRVTAAHALPKYVGVSQRKFSDPRCPRSYRLPQMCWSGIRIH
jgi:hypothetical protein